MITQISKNPEIYKINVPLEGSPLKNLASYVLKSRGESLVVDTGFNSQSCYDALTNGLNALGVDMSKRSSTLFLTHLHSDHIGLVPRIAKGCRVLMSELDFRVFEKYQDGSAWRASDEYYERQGVPSGELRALHSSNPARAMRPDSAFKAEFVRDKDTISIGDVKLTAIHTPGHTPGHMCLAHLESSTLFAGDHILFDITSNIAVWQTFMKDALGEYLNSLNKIRALDIQLCLSAHRESAKPANGRIDEILAHHARRLDDIRGILSEHPDITAYQTASYMKWKMRGKNWAEFPPQQKWFAVGETISHLEYLRIRKEVRFSEKNGLIYWRLT